jgi:hypothetical protein
MMSLAPHHSSARPRSASLAEVGAFALGAAQAGLLVLATVPLPMGVAWLTAVGFLVWTAVRRRRTAELGATLAATLLFLALHTDPWFAPTIRDAWTIRGALSLAAVGLVLAWGIDFFDPERGS